ncbi:MAG: terminase large subunit, partial [Methanocorpusculum sp.]|nr:terminase large subunit [Methanocorpusculum sp.]
GAIKGPDSVRYGIKWLQSLKKIVIDPVTCPETKKEFTGYEYERTADGEIMSGYHDEDNHSIDSVRYAMERVWKRKGQ